MTIKVLNKDNNGLEKQEIKVPRFSTAEKWEQDVQNAYYLLKRHALLQSVTACDKKLSTEKDKKKVEKIKEVRASYVSGVDTIEKQGTPAEWSAASRAARAYVVSIGFVGLELSGNDEERDALWFCRKYIELDEMEAPEPAKIQAAEKAAREAIKKALASEGVTIAKVTKRTLNAIVKPCRTGVKGDRKTGGTVHAADKVQVWIKAFWLELFSLSGCEVTKKAKATKDALSV